LRARKALSRAFPRRAICDDDFSRSPASTAVMPEDRCHCHWQRDRAGVGGFGGHRGWGKPSKGVWFVSNRGRLAPFVVSVWKNDANPRKYAMNLFYALLSPLFL
jgi:hypothetical protein